MKYFKRILALPFMVLLQIASIPFVLIKLSRLFILYGGEFIVYDKKTTVKSIETIFKILEEQHLKNQHKNQ